jgi:hypothetical protein
MISVEVRAILAALERIVYLLLSVLGVAQALGLNVDRTARESTPYRIQGQVDWIGSQLTGQPWSLPVLHNQLTAIIATLDGLNAPVLDAIAALPAGSDIVIPSGADNAEAVWFYQGPWSDKFGNMLDWLTGNYSRDAAHQTFLCAGAPWFACYDPHAKVD